jgi:hypothetical protein
MSQFTHKVQKYALIHCAAEEIKAHLDELKVCSNKDVELHILQIEKAAMFIQFVEDIYIISMSEEIQDWQIKDMWHIIQDPECTYYYGPEDNAILWKPVIAKMKEYQKKINGKFFNVTSPF